MITVPLICLLLLKHKYDWETSSPYPCTIINPISLIYLIESIWFHHPFDSTTKATLTHVHMLPTWNVHSNRRAPAKYSSHTRDTLNHQACINETFLNPCHFAVDNYCPPLKGGVPTKGMGVPTNHPWLFCQATAKQEKGSLLTWDGWWSWHRHHTTARLPRAG